jgi:hypothetical protein
MIDDEVDSIVDDESLSIYFYRETWQKADSWYCRAVAQKTAADHILLAHLEALQRCSKDPEFGERIWSARGAISTGPNLMLFPIYMLLMGYALENIFKGIVICNMYLDNPQSVEKFDFKTLQFICGDNGQKKHINKHALSDLYRAKAMMSLAV